MDVDSELAVQELEKAMAETFNSLISLLQERHPNDLDTQIKLILLADRYYRNNSTHP